MTVFRILVTLAIALVSVSASAQYGTWGYDANTRQWVPPGVPVNNAGIGFSSQPAFNSQVVYTNPPNTAYYFQPNQLTSLPNGMFLSGSNTYRCSTLRATIGGFVGALIGYGVGKQVTTSHHRLGGLGAVGGAALGTNVACELAEAPAQQAAMQQAAAQPTQQGGVRHTCPVGNYVIDVAPNQDCRNLDEAVRAVGGQTLNQQAMPPLGGQPVAQAQQPQGQAPSVTTPIQKDGHTCAAFTKDGRLAMDFLSTDRALNPLAAPVQTGEQCAAAKKQYANG